VSAATSGAQTASVFVAVTDGPVEAAAGSTTMPTFRERLQRRYWRYELDLTHHPVALRFQLPAREEAFAFTATVTLLWAVQNPIEVAVHGVRDLKPIIWTFLNQTLRGVSRQFGIEEVRAAEAEMRLALEKQAGDIGFGLRLPMVGVSLRLDEETERYLSQRVQTDRAGNLADDRHDLARQEAEHEKLQAEWQGMLEEARSLHRRNLDAAQAKHAREIERLNTEHDTALKSQRLNFYRDALVGGSHDAMVLQLIENPSDVGSVLRLIETGDEKHFTRSREILLKLLENQMAGAADLDDLTQHTISELRTALSAVAPKTETIVKESVRERMRTETERDVDRVIHQKTT
jgi:hypothetical protein